MNMPERELHPQSITEDVIRNSDDGNGDDLWDEDGNGDGDDMVRDDEVIRNSDDGDGDDLWDDDDGDGDDMEREWQRRQQEFHRLGYREGLMAGKEASAQEGFNLGFKESVFVGRNWGHVRGVTSALACLPDDLREKLVETDEQRRKFQSLHESVGAISTNDALKLFYNSLINGRRRSSEQVEEATQTGSGTGDLRSQSSDGDVLEDYVQECKMLVHECSGLNLKGR